MNGSAKVLITGIGCVGKSSLRRRVAEALGRKVVCIDRDDGDLEPERAPGQVLVIESVHGLDEPPESWGLVVYLLPPPGHTLRWIRRGFIWFRTGQVDRPPRALRRAWSLLNIPLIVRLVGRNVWNASRWVREDRKCIGEFFPNCSIVTDEAEHAFHEIHNFISRMYEKREGMADRYVNLPKDPKGWIIESINLDLIYDEEKDQPKDFEKLPGSPAALPKSEDCPQSWYKSFYELKSIRIKVSLELDNAGINYASREKDEDEKKDTEEEVKFSKRLRDARKKYITNLNIISRRCASAIDLLWQNEWNGKVNEKVATLLALFHSELCASSTKDVSWGQAKSFKNSVPEYAVGFSIFQWIAMHSVARSEVHLGLSMEAINRVVPLVDSFDKELDNLAQGIFYKDDGYTIENNRNILIRALYFQASRTLSQALGDLKRHAESRYYLKKAFDESNNQENNYWIEFFKLILLTNRIETKILNKDTKVDLKELINKKCKPRMEDERRGVLSRYPIEAADPKWIKLWNENGIFGTDWEESEKWLLRWHSSEPQQLGQHLGTIAKQVISALKNRSNGSQNEELFTIIVDVFLIAEATLKNFNYNGNESHVYWLLGENLDGLKDVSQPDKSKIWIQGRVLYGALRELTRKIDSSKITNESKECVAKWEHRLKKLIRSDQFDLVRSRASKVETLQESQEPESEFSCWCNDCDSSECDHSCSVNELLRDLPNHNGINDVSLDRPEASCSDNKRRSNKRNNEEKGMASREYYYNVMSMQQTRFLSYLQKRTGRDRFYQQGEAPRLSPCFEIICLRRWNSFSPNLGSRAAATIGGGYFVRAWAGGKENGRYIGIVIDPGYNFLENFFNEGFTIADIDLVAITHSHPDHIENFTNLLTLFRERDKRLNKETTCDPRTSPKDHRVLLAMTEGVFERIRLILSAEEEFIRDIAVLSAKEFRGNGAGKSDLDLRLDDKFVCHMSLGDAELTDEKIVSLEAVRAWHNDSTGYDTIGLKIKHHNCKTGCNVKICDKSGKNTADEKILGIIGDSRYESDLHVNYIKCNVLVTHLGSLVNDNMYKNFHKAPDEKTFFDPANINSNLKTMLAEENHLYFPGIARLICKYHKSGDDPKKFPLMILSEFGEELRGGLRKDIAKRLSLTWNPNHGDNGGYEYLPIIPGDVGLRVDIENKKVFCCICHRYVEPEKITPETVMPDEESMTYVCSDCKVSREGEMNTLLEEWCRTGRPVVALESNTDQPF